MRTARIASPALSVLVTVLLATVFFAASAHATGGMNLAWDDCGVFGASQRNFACDTNAGFDVLYGSAIAPVAMPQLNGQSSTIELVTDQPTLSSWWQLGNGECRGSSPAAATASFDFTSNVNCLDPWSGAAVGGLTATSFAGGSPNRARIRTACGISGTTAIDDAHEYYFFKVLISHAHTVGTGSCAGCTDGACIVFRIEQLTQPGGVGDYTMTEQPIHQIWVKWQAGNVTGGCPAATPARPATWGAVKSLYR